MTYVLGIDLGTSSLKGLLMNREGQVVAEASATYPLIHLAPGYSEQDPYEWRDALDKVFKQLGETIEDFQENLRGISFSGMSNNTYCEMRFCGMMCEPQHNAKRSWQNMERNCCRLPKISH